MNQLVRVDTDGSLGGNASGRLNNMILRLSASVIQTDSRKIQFRKVAILHKIMTSSHPVFSCPCELVGYFRQTIGGNRGGRQTELRVTPTQSSLPPSNTRLPEIVGGSRSELSRLKMDKH